MTTSTGNSKVGYWPKRLRVAAAGVLVAGSGLLLLGEVLGPSSENYLAAAASSPTRYGWSAAVSLLAVPFLVGTALAWAALGVARSPRVSWTGGVLMITGATALAAVVGAETAQFSMVRTGMDPATVAGALTGAGGIAVIVLLVMFLGGVVVGVGLLQIAFWRSRAAPRGAVLLMLLFLILDVTPLGALTGFPTHVLMVIASGWMAVALIRTKPAVTAVGIVQF